VKPQRLPAQALPDSGSSGARAPDETADHAHVADRLHVVWVEIQGQRYGVRSRLDDGYVKELAAYVDRRMSAAADESVTGESLKVAVLAALNIADELFSNRADKLADRLRARTEEIERIVDLALRES
jgi:cell division protein ZapA